MANKTQGRHPHKDIGKKVCRAIRERRVASGMSMADLAAKAGLSRQAVGQFERCANTPSVGVAAVLFAALGIKARLIDFVE